MHALLASPSLVDSTTPLQAAAAPPVHQRAPGVAFEVLDGAGILRSKGSHLVEIVCHNNCCGRFQDSLLVEVDGLPAVTLPLTVCIRGVPLILHPHTVGLKLSKDLLAAEGGSCLL